MFPQYFQFDSMDCGPTCLRMVASSYGKEYSPSTLRERCHIGKEGVSLLGISHAAQSIGFNAEGLRVSWEQFHDTVSLPCIAHWDGNHFVVAYKVSGKGRRSKVHVADPASGHRTLRLQDFLSHWQNGKGTGIVLNLEPTERFYGLQGDVSHKYG